MGLELLTVFGAGPLAVWVCELVRRGRGEEGRLWFWACVLATGELYGGEFDVFPLLEGGVGLYMGPLEANFILCGRLHDFCTGVVEWEHESGYEQFHVSLGLSVFLQHAMGCVPAVGAS